MVASGCIIPILVLLVVIGNSASKINTYIDLNRDNVTAAIWLTEGSSDCSWFDTSKIDRAVDHRDNIGGIAKVLQWTIDDEGRIRRALR